MIITYTCLPEGEYAYMERQRHRGLKQFDRAKFDHVGFLTTNERPNETWLQAERLWLTDPRDHLCRIEFLRYAPNSPTPARLQQEPHVAYRVDDLEEALREHSNIIRTPFDPSGAGTLRVAFVDVDGALVEFMEYRMPHSLP
jgi:hypothetical protein